MIVSLERYSYPHPLILRSEQYKIIYLILKHIHTYKTIIQ